MALSGPESGSTTDSEDDYDPLTPYVFDIEYDVGEQPVFHPVLPKDHTTFGPSFQLPHGVDATPGALFELFLPDQLLDGWVASTNLYSRARLARDRVNPVTRPELLRFLAIIYYMGVVRLPSKADYFLASDGVLPVHHVLKLSRKRFDYIWRNVHTSFKPNSPLDEGNDAANSDAEELLEDVQVVVVNDGVDEDDEVDEEGEEEALLNTPAPLWYDTIKGFIYHVRKVSKELCKHPGWVLSLDEMLKKFKGRSAMTFRMKKKPEKEGYKLYAICDTSTGYVFDFFPDGRLEKKKTIDAVKELIECIPRRETLQYVLGMDNFFTTTDVIKATRALNVGVVGTARKRRNWPPKEMGAIDDERFNTLYCLPSKDNYMIFGWVDNLVVLMVSTIHTGTEVVEKQRKRPRTNQQNKHRMQTAFGNEAVKTMDIPQVIDDYNHWMGGVDKADQLIAYYKPRIRCRRVWMPLFFHCLDVIRLNSYIIAKHKKQTTTQKQWVLDVIKQLNQRADYEEYQFTRRQAAALATPPSTGKGKRQRVSTKTPSLPTRRFAGAKEDHVAVLDDDQKACRYCCYVRAVAKLEGTTPLPEVARPRRMCFYCKDHLCTLHFDLYHSQNYHGGRYMSA